MSLTPGTDAPDAPPELADQVVVALQFPVATEYLVAPLTLPIPTVISKAKMRHFQNLSVRIENKRKDNLFPETRMEGKEEKYAIVKLQKSINTVG